MKKLTIGLSLAALTLAGGTLAAQTAAPRGDWANKTMTRADVQAHAVQMFDKLDANRDGKLDAADRAAHEGQMFDRIDTDHNGAISRDEFLAMHQRGAMGGHGMPGMDAGAEGAGHGRMGGRPMGGHGDRAMGGHGMMARMADANGDGTITRDEFVAGALKHFDMADADHNGTITAAERQAAHAAMGGHRRRGGDMAPPPPGE